MINKPAAAAAAASSVRSFVVAPQYKNTAPVPIVRFDYPPLDNDDGDDATDENGPVSAISATALASKADFAALAATESARALCSRPLPSRPGKPRGLGLSTVNGGDSAAVIRGSSHSVNKENSTPVSRGGL